jgi:Uma2 family endonuclease
MVVCEDKTSHEYYTESPVIIVEILSKSTRRTDRALKRLAYQRLPSLQEYVLIEQDFVEVEICRRAKHWQSEFYFLGDEACFASIDLTLAVVEIYARVANEDMAEFLKAAAQAKPADSLPDGQAI